MILSFEQTKTNDEEVALAGHDTDKFKIQSRVKIIMILEWEVMMIPILFPFIMNEEDRQDGCTPNRNINPVKDSQEIIS